jgi:hypothetical protein
MKTNHIIIGILVLIAAIIATQVFLNMETFQTTTPLPNTVDIPDFVSGEPYAQYPTESLKTGDVIRISRNQGLPYFKQDLFTYSEENYTGDMVIYPQSDTVIIPQSGAREYTLTKDVKSLRTGNLIHKFDYSYANFARNMTGMTGSPNKTTGFHADDKSEHQIIVDVGYQVTTYDADSVQISQYTSGEHIISASEVFYIFAEHQPTTITFKTGPPLAMNYGDFKTQIDDYAIESLYVSIGNIVELYEGENSEGKKHIYRYSPGSHTINGIVKTINILKVEPALEIFTEDNFGGEPKQFDNLSFSVNLNVIPSVPFSMKIKTGIRVRLHQLTYPEEVSPEMTDFIDAGEYTYEQLKPMMSKFDLDMTPLNIRLVYGFTDAQVANYRDPLADVTMKINIGPDELHSLVTKAMDTIVPKTTATVSP